MVKYVEEKDLVMLNNVADGTKEVVLAACGDPDHGHWYCATHLYSCPKDTNFNLHLEDNAFHLVGWACDKHGVEVP